MVTPNRKPDSAILNDEHEPSANAKRVLTVDLPTVLGKNASMTLTWTGDELTKIEKTIDGVTYRRTFTWSSGNLVSFSIWSVV